MLHQNHDAAPGDTVRTEDIIDAVISYPILYDTSRQDYLDMVKKENAWKAVAEATGCASEYITLWINKARTIKFNPRKTQNDPILPNPAKTVQKNLLEFADDLILPL